MTRRLGVAALALVAAIGLLAVPAGPAAPAEVRAAQPDLTIVTDASYSVDPGNQRVRVTVDMTMRNHLKDTKTKRYYFDEAYLAVQPGISGMKLSWDGKGTPRVRVARKTKTYTLLRFDFASRLYSGKSANYRLTFNLRDRGGAPTRDLRIGDSLVAFPVWAFASDSTPGSSVTVAFPKGFDVRIEAGDIGEPTLDGEGRVILRSGRIARPLDFFAYLVADRPGSYTETEVTTTVADDEATVTVRAWPDDPAWAERVTTLLTEGLPAMGERVGLPWPHDEPLIVQEAISRSTGGYAGLFDPAERKVEIAYYADDFVVLHEAAHTWFNGVLLADRWANEAFASYYATQVAADLEVEVQPDELTDELEAARIPLNGWGPVGSEEADQEDYAYAAALALATAIAERAGDDGLRRVWADASDGIGAYQPLGSPPETVDAVPDWRGLLDLLEERTDKTYDDLWREWVARPADLPLLDARLEARERLDRVEGTTAGWRLPRPIRDAMRAWQFEDATALIDGAEAALEQRTAVEAAADAAGLIPPDTLRSAFEDDDGFDDALSEAAAELETISRYTAAVASKPSETTPFVVLGMWSETPEADLVAARNALARGDLDAAAASAAEAQATWSSATAIGQGRALSIALLALAFLLALGLILAAWRRHRRRRRRLVMARPLGND